MDQPPENGFEAQEICGNETKTEKGVIISNEQSKIFIPNEALKSNNEEQYLSELTSLSLNTPIGVVWIKPSVVNEHNNNVGIMKGTRGVVVKNEKDYLLLKHSQTVTLEPFSIDIMNPEPTFITIPKRLILKISFN